MNKLETNELNISAQKKERKEKGKKREEIPPFSVFAWNQQNVIGSITALPPVWHALTALHPYALISSSLRPNTVVRSMPDIIISSPLPRRRGLRLTDKLPGTMETPKIWIPSAHCTPHPTPATYMHTHPSQILSEGNGSHAW